MYLLPELATMHPLPKQNPELWESLKKANYFLEYPTMASLARVRWVVINFLGLRFRGSVLAQLRVLQCDIFAVGHIDGEHMTAIFRHQFHPDWGCEGGERHHPELSSRQGLQR